MRHTARPLSITAVVIIALIVFIYFQKRAANPELNTALNSTQPTVVIAYQTGIDPTKIAQANADYEHDSQRAIQWKKFDTGADIVNALASGDVDIGNIGTSPLAAAASRNLPLEVFFVAAQLGGSEALVISQAAGIEQAKDLVGKTIAVPFVSTAHYSLLAALKHWQIPAEKVKIINLRPTEIAAAWQRGDIDAAYVWQPTLSQAKASGHVLTDSEQVAQWGAATFDVWVVRKEFAAKNPEFLKSFVHRSLASIDEYNQNPQAFIANKAYLKKIADLTGSQPQDIAVLLSGNRYLNQAEQLKLFKHSLADDLLNTAMFLKSQGKVDQVKASYKDHINSAFLQP